jgi:hypothetical protein
MNIDIERNKNLLYLILHCFPNYAQKKMIQKDLAIITHLIFIIMKKYSKIQ